jgi:hypothetical protein
MADRTNVLQAAMCAISGDRNEAYGDAGENFDAVAQMWGAYKGVSFTRADVAAMMILLKVARVRVSPDLPDHWIDIAGYAALGSEANGTFNVNKLP